MSARSSGCRVIAAVDSRDRVIGLIARRDALGQGANFRVAHLFLFNDDSELLMQRLPASRPRYPACGGSSVAAYVRSAETYRKAIVRRTYEELGVRLQGRKFVGRTAMTDEGSTKFICAYAAIWNVPITGDTDHISQVKSLSMDEVNQLKRDQAWMLTPTFLHLWDAFHAEPS
ncbi:MAG: NUDIX domain-containing protein [Bryobacterales bacterium]|nr:NUDIX domain-containing protein [Bryobacterales bacterium]